mmetsp:Transcript_12225/g.22920  ORF Transcript_12225/g.22920 Transcript_12225/m.22920 type:complete len:976 (-) Transcript_12225:242-3169(-)
MKRRKFIPLSFTHTSGDTSSGGSSWRPIRRSHSIITRADNDTTRVQVLPKSTSDFVRAGQVIGSSFRAMEELVHNAVVHGRAKAIDITFGTTGGGAAGSSSAIPFLKVADDGIGIDEASTRQYIGTKNCSSQIFFRDNKSATDATADVAQMKNYYKGESLKALASLSIEFRIFTTYVVERSGEDGILSASAAQKETACGGGAIRRRNLLASAPEKPLKKRKRKSFLDESANSIIHRSQQKAPRAALVTSTMSTEKIVRNNETFLFRSFPNTNVVKPTGTSIELFGLFHKHHVRLKQHQQMMQDGNHQVPWSKVRNCVQVLAMAYPHVTIRLYSTKNTTMPDTVWAQSTSIAKIGPSLFDHQRFSMHPLYTMAMKQRLLDLNGMDGADVNSGTFLRVFYSESCNNSNNSDEHKLSSKDFVKDKTLTGVINSMRESKKKWNICGILYEMLLPPNSTTSESLSSTAKKDNGFIFVNGRLYKHQAALLDLVFSICHCNDDSSKAYSSQWSFVFHITCPSFEVNLVHDEFRSYSVVGQRNRLIDLISCAIKNAFHEDSKRRVMYHGDQNLKESHSLTTTTGSNLLSNSTDSLLYRSTRIISGEHLKKNICNERNDKVDILSINNSDAISRKDTLFDDAFSLQAVNYKGHMMSPRTKTAVNINNEQTTRLPTIRPNQSQLGMTWTKSKLKALDTQIASLTHASKSNHPIVITKDMLSKAEIIAQLDSKFIVVNMCGILSLLDQHAADERVGLERLEEALQKNLCPSEKEQGCEKFDLSKLKNIRTDDLVKRTPLKNPKSIDISPFLSSVIANYESIIKKWNFDYDHDPIRHKVLLKSVPSICDKVATEKDFIQYTQSLGHQSTSTASTAQPTFVKRTLASYACRYAIMFGDVLDDDTCKSLLSSLSKCELCFICAHGRPSIVPLIDLNLMPDGGSYRSTSGHISSARDHGKNLPTNDLVHETIPIRFRHLYQQRQMKSLHR